MARKPISYPCDNCGDGKGWHAWYPMAPDSLKPLGLVWGACADCNDDMQKPKPDLCEACGQTEPFCLCASVVHA